MVRVTTRGGGPWYPRGLGLGLGLRLAGGPWYPRAEDLVVRVTTRGGPLVPPRGAKGGGGGGGGGVVGWARAHGRQMLGSKDDFQ